MKTKKVPYEFANNIGHPANELNNCCCTSLIIFSVFYNSGIRNTKSMKKSKVLLTRIISYSLIADGQTSVLQ